MGMGVDGPVWGVTVVTKHALWPAQRDRRNRDRLLEGEIATKFLGAVLDQSRVKALLSDEHFSVDGTLIQAWTSMKSFQPKSGSGEPPEPGRNRLPRTRSGGELHGEKRTNETQVSATDPEARLYRKGRGKEASLSFMGHALNGLIVEGRVSEASGSAERDEAQAMIKVVPGRHPITVGGDKVEPVLRPARRDRADTQGFAAGMWAVKATPHMAQNTTNRRYAIDGRTTRRPGNAQSQWVRKRVEEAFGWMKEKALLRRGRHRGRGRIEWQFKLAVAASSLTRLPKLLGATA